MAVDDVNYRLLSDEPGGEFGRKDELRFSPAAEVLTGAALQARNPITIGVFGNWGTGKTSFMRLMEGMVNERGRVVDLPEKKGKDVSIKAAQLEDAAIPVWFNAWQYEREEHLIIPLIATIAREIELRRKKWGDIKLSDDVEDAVQVAFESLKRGSKDLYDRLRAALYGISVKGKLPVPLPGGLEIGASVKDMVERYETITQDTLMARSLYFDAFDKLRELARQPEEEVKRPQIVVFIDDLDRCFPEKAVNLLESVKLILHLPGFAFVLGIYPEIIEEFVRNKYLSQYPLAAMKAMGEGKEGSENHLCKRMNEYLLYFDKYLEKIVQVAHLVPQREPDEMHQYILQLLADAQIDGEFIPDEMNEAERSELLEVIAEVGERNPRSIVRRINRFIVKWRIINSERSDNEEACSILALVVNEKAGDKKYSDFRGDLNVSVNGGNEAERKLGAFLADELGKPGMQNAPAHRDRIQILRDAENELACDEVRKKRVASAISTLENDPGLLNVLRTNAGLQWLREKEFRENLHEKAGEPQSSKTARKEEADSEEPRENMRKTGDDAIRELLPFGGPGAAPVAYIIVGDPPEGIVVVADGIHTPEHPLLEVQPARRRFAPAGQFLDAREEVAGAARVHVGLGRHAARRDADTHLLDGAHHGAVVFQHGLDEGVHPRAVRQLVEQRVPLHFPLQILIGQIEAD